MTFKVTRRYTSQFSFNFSRTEVAPHPSNSKSSSESSRRLSIFSLAVLERKTFIIVSLKKYLQQIKQQMHYLLGPKPLTDRLVYWLGTNDQVSRHKLQIMVASPAQLFSHGITDTRSLAHALLHKRSTRKKRKIFIRFKYYLYCLWRVECHPLCHALPLLEMDPYSEYVSGLHADNDKFDQLGVHIHYLFLPQSRFVELYEGQDI